MERAEAETLVDLMLEAHRPVSESWGARVVRYGRAERSGAPADVAQCLAELYAEPHHAIPQRAMVAVLESGLMPGLAEALEEDEDALRYRLHQGRPLFVREAVFLPDPPGLEVADPPPPEGWHHTASFRVFGNALVIAPLPQAQQRLELKARNGRWRVFSLPYSSWRSRAREARGQKSSARRTYVIAHLDYITRALELLSEETEFGAVETRLNISVLDLTAREDPRVISAAKSLDGTRWSFTFKPFATTTHWSGVRLDGEVVLLETEDGTG
jgi:hypothetical protein